MKLSNDTREIDKEKQGQVKKYKVLKILLYALLILSIGLLLIVFS